MKLASVPVFRDLDGWTRIPVGLFTAILRQVDRVKPFERIAEIGEVFPQQVIRARIQMIPHFISLGWKMVDKCVQVTDITLKLDVCHGMSFKL